MAAFGSGAVLWRVDVVLRRAGSTQQQADAVVNRVAASLDARPTTPDESVFGDVRPTHSFDMEPPEGSVGVSCWVHADTLGEAAQVGLDTVVAAAAGVTGVVLPLWDLRVVPRSAITTREEYERGLAIIAGHPPTSKPH